MAPSVVMMAQEHMSEPVSRTYQYRKVMKPMLERKRRARINRCLDELKELMTGALHNNDGESVTKLEKADILELTVRHLHNLRRQNKLYATASAAYADRFKAGFSHCASEVSQFLNKIDRNANAHLMRHLTECMQRVDVLIPSPPPATQPPPPPPSSHQISPMHRVSNSPPITQYYSKEFSLNPHSTILKSDTSVNNNYLQPNHIAPKQECSTFSSTGSNNNNNNNNLDNRPVINYSNKLPKEEPHSGDVWRPW